MKASARIWFGFITLLLFFVTGCSPFVKDGQPIMAASNVVLRPGATIGQTFTARDRGLNGVEVFLAPDATASGEIRLHLRASSQSTTDIALGTLSAQGVTAPGFYRFDFAPQSNSRQQDYYLIVDLLGSGSVRVGTASGDTYLDGALYQNGTPVDAQMSFRLAYDPVELVIGLVSQTALWVRVLTIAALVFVLPGWALLVYLLPIWSTLSWGEKLGLAAGVSIAIYPVLFLWTDLIGLHLGPLYAWLPMVLAAIALLWYYRAWRPIELAHSLIAWRRSKNVLPDLMLLALIGAIFGVRFWVIRSLDVPMWGDSYQHTMITQLLVDHGGLFTSWQPYADLVTFTYHFGFHAASAVFHWVSTMEVPQAVLWTGQILNGLAVLVLYPLAIRIGINRWAGVGAVLIAGLLSPMPMYYVNWGRYTQLAGQVVLPTTILLSWEVFEERVRNWRLLGLSWLAWGGLALTHYRILIIALPFIVAYLILELPKIRVIEFIGKVWWLGIGGAVLFLPWFIRTFAGKITSSFAQKLSTPAEATSAFTQQYNAIGELSNYLPIILWLLLVICVGIGLWQRNKAMAIICLWWFFILLEANPQWLHLPGEGALSNFAVFIAAYLPTSLVLGAILGQSKIGVRRDAMQWLILGLVAALALWGIPQRLEDLQLRSSELVTRADIRAVAWVRQNTPSDARFLVNSFFVNGTSLIVGSDGGWWLPLLSERQTTLPPVNYSSEQSNRPDYRNWVQTLPKKIQELGMTNPEVLALLQQYGIQFVYVGQRQGRVNYGGSPMLRTEELMENSHFHLLYKQDRIQIFRFDGF